MRFFKCFKIISQNDYLFLYENAAVEFLKIYFSDFCEESSTRVFGQKQAQFFKFFLFYN